MKEPGPLPDVSDLVQSGVSSADARRGIVQTRVARTQKKG
jgi:hypothetical protein